MTQGKSVVVLGSGLMGSSLALDLISSNIVEKLTVVDSNPDRLKLLEQRAKRGRETDYGKNYEKLDTLSLDVTKEPEELKNLLSKFELGVGALPHGIAEKAVLASVEAGVDFVDLIFSWHYEGVSQIDSRAKKSGATIVPACGLAPGLTNILAKYGADQLEEVDYIKISVGGIPEAPKPPLNYRIVFAVDSVLEEYVRDAVIVRGGKKIVVPALSGLEEMKFSELPNQEFEAFITDGLSTLPETLKKVNNMEEKTIRWKGHAEDIALLIDLGLFSERPVTVGRTGSRVAPRSLLSLLLDRKLAMHQGDKDMTLLRVDITGKKRKGDKATRVRQYEMVDRFDSETQTTSMARTTAYPCSVVAQMILEGKITETGFLPPELAIHDDRFDEYLSRLERKGLNIKQREFLSDQ